MLLACGAPGPVQSYVQAREPDQVGDKEIVLTGRAGHSEWYMVAHEESDGRACVWIRATHDRRHIDPEAELRETERTVCVPAEGPARKRVVYDELPDRVYGERPPPPWLIFGLGQGVDFERVYADVFVGAGWAEGDVTAVGDRRYFAVLIDKVKFRGHGLGAVDFVDSEGRRVMRKTYRTP